MSDFIINMIKQDELFSIEGELARARFAIMALVWLGRCPPAHMIEAVASLLVRKAELEQSAA